MLKTRLLLIIFGIFLVYVLGVFMRRTYGVCLVIKNDGGETLQEVALKFEGWNYRYVLAVPDLPKSHRMRLFVKPGRKSHVTLEFTDSRKVRHAQTAEDYVFGNDCGKVIFTVHAAGAVEATIPTHPEICWDSWFGFIY
jgi:hypothetical protein